MPTLWRHSVCPAVPLFWALPSSPEQGFKSGVISMGAMNELEADYEVGQTPVVWGGGAGGGRRMDKR